MGYSFKRKKKKEITITNGFQKILEESNRKSNKVWVYKSNQLILIDHEITVRKKRYINVFNT